MKVYESGEVLFANAARILLGRTAIIAKLDHDQA
jgi:hypothetical protein